MSNNFYNKQKEKLNLMRSKNPKVYFDLTIGAKAAGKVIFELFTDLTPKTTENFRGLCTGEYGKTGLSSDKKPLHYLNTVIHKV